MFEISLISPYSSIFNLGLRTISSVLRDAGYRTKMIFLPMPSSESAWKLSPHFQMEYSEPLLNQLSDLTKTSSLIGLSLMDNYFQIGVQLTRTLKKEDNLIVWGGACPSMNPEAGLQHTDAVCIGDGEYALLELANRLSSGQAVKAIHNLWFQGKPYPQLESIQDISLLPLPDYGPEGHFIYIEKEKSLVSPATYEDYQRFLDKAPDPSRKLAPVYRIETVRGCPHNCTYCGNNFLKKVQSPKLRFVRIDQIEKELIWVKNNFPLVRTIFIEDDCFMARKNIRQVVQLFKDLDFSFRCLISPPYFSEESMEYLIQSGLFVCQIGIQTRAPRIEAMYRRSEINRKIDRVFEFFKKNHPDIPLLVDILINNPWELTEETLYTLHYLLDYLPPKSFIGINSLVFYPGTELCEKARKDNLLESHYYLKTWHWHRQNKILYTTLLLVLLKARLPRNVIRFLAIKPFVFLFEREFITSRILPRVINIMKRFINTLRNRKSWISQP